MRFYVYALIDPINNNEPFYIGKGSSGRTEEHFRETGMLAKKARLVGDSMESVFAQGAEAERDIPLKNQKIRDLQSKGYSHQHIARIITHELDEESAFAIEACLIKFVYGRADTQLLNQKDGHHSERFRTRDVWGHIDEFDPNTENGLPNIAPEFENRPHYVYVLLDPSSRQVFYVGKGIGNRLAQHFSDAINNIDNGQKDRLNRLRDLLNQGYKPSQIGRVVAYLDNENLAFDIEALLITFVYGTNNLTNIRSGHRWQNNRPHDCWDAIEGFDHPRVVNPEIPQDRAWLRRLLIADGLGLPLEAIRLAFAEINFDEPNVLDAGELGIEGDIRGPNGEVGTRIKVFTRRENIQIELRPRLKEQKDWMLMHFKRLGADQLLRKDRVFLPSIWKGAANMIRSVEEACDRIRLLLGLISSIDGGQLSMEIKCLVHQCPEKDTYAYSESSQAVSINNEMEPINEPVALVTRSVPPGSEYDVFEMIRDSFPDINFDEPRTRDADRGLSIEGDIGFNGFHVGVLLKVIQQARGIQCELRPRTDYQREWVRNHFTGLAAFGALRRDSVFLPVPWNRNPAGTVQEAIDRVALLLEIADTFNRKDLSEEASAILVSRPEKPKKR